MRRHLDARLICLLLAALTALAGIFNPHWPMRRQAVDMLLVVDITGSMMVRDYPGGSTGLSRLERVQAAIAAILAELPCGSRAGLAIFSERKPFLLLAPMETCANYAALTGSVQRLDWRMAWEGDSFISRGLFGAIDLAAEFEADPVFFTDGHEAPPLLLGSSAPHYAGTREQPSGLIVGVGDLAASPIPKFDDDGRQIGTWAADEVIQENRTGLPPSEVQQREGYEPRNAPWGAAAAEGEEHLSGLREGYLQALATGAGLGYVRLQDEARVVQAIQHHLRSRPVQAPIPLRPWLALSMLVFLLAFCLFSLWSLREHGILPGHRRRVAFSVVERSVS